MRGSVIIVMYNAGDLIGGCLTSLRDSMADSGITVVVVDNASTDGSAHQVRSSFPEVSLIESPENGGFAAGNNLGCRAATGDWIFLLNPDARLETDCLKTLWDYLRQHPEVGIVSPAILDPGGKPTTSFFCFTTLLYSLISAVGLTRILPLNRIDGHWVITREIPSRPVEVDRVLGAAMMIRREIWEQVQGMDEAFFLYSEEEDLCYRVHRAGWKIVFHPGASVMHIGGGITRKSNALAIASASWSRYLYLRKHSAPLAAEISRWMWIIMLSVRLALTSLFGGKSGSSQGYRWAIRSLWRPGWFEDALRPARKKGM